MTQAPSRARGARTPRPARPERWLQRATTTVIVLVSALGLFAVVTLAAGRGSGPASLPLPNPMGGPALHAPAATGEPVAFGGLEVVAPDVDMGRVPLNVTMVPGWQVTNPTGGDLGFVVGRPQVHEGCCPGPVVVDEVVVQPGDRVTVPAGGRVLVQFPLQMHPGMDGPHHLTIPLAADGEQTDLHVTGDFRADA